MTFLCENCNKISANIGLCNVCTDEMLIHSVRRSADGWKIDRIKNAEIDVQHWAMFKIVGQDVNMVIPNTASYYSEKIQKLEDVTSDFIEQLRRRDDPT